MPNHLRLSFRVSRIVFNGTVKLKKKKVFKAFAKKKVNKAFAMLKRAQLSEGQIET